LIRILGASEKQNLGRALANSVFDSECDVHAQTTEALLGLENAQGKRGAMGRVAARNTAAAFGTGNFSALADRAEEEIEQRRTERRMQDLERRLAESQRRLAVAEGDSGSVSGSDTDDAALADIRSVNDNPANLRNVAGRLVANRKKKIQVSIFIMRRIDFAKE